MNLRKSTQGEGPASQKQESPTVALPAGLPKPHALRAWGKWLEKERINRGLTDVAREQFPPGLFPKKWSKEALEPVEEPPADASWKDKQAYKLACLKLEERRAFNAQLKERKETWWRDRLNEYFDLLTSSMEDTQPGLREVLRSKFACGDGYYDGVAAMLYITAWIKNSLIHNPQHDYYDKGHRLIVEKRLGTGATDREFAAVARRWAFDINPFVRAPYTGDAMGKFIIEKIMPPYADASDRLVDELRKEGLLHDYESVIDRCTTIVQRRATKGAAANVAILEIGTSVGRPPALSSTWLAQRSAMGHAASTASQCRLPRPS